MGRPFPPESTPSRLGFGADLASAARALLSQPSVPLVSLAVTLQFFFITNAVKLAVLLFLLGWYGAERVFFQRHLQGRSVSLPHLLRLVKPFMGRFLVLGVLCVTVLATFFDALDRVFGIAIPAHIGANTPVPVKLIMAVLAIVTDFSLTFVTPALAYTTRSAVRAVRIGFAMIGQTWPRSALYVLCPPLALNLLNYVFPFGGLVLQLTTTFVVTLVGLLAKGAIAAFYLRERGSYSEDGAAYRVPPDRRRPPLTHQNEAPTVSP